MQALNKMDGEWKLVYTSNSELIALLALSKLPFVTIGDVTQRVDAATSTVTNKVRPALAAAACTAARPGSRIQNGAWCVPLCQRASGATCQRHC